MIIINTLNEVDEMAEDQDLDPDAAVIPESNDEDEDIQAQPRRSGRPRNRVEDDQIDELSKETNVRPTRRSLRSAATQPQATSRTRRQGIDDTSDFEPGADDAAEEDVSSSEGSSHSKDKGDSDGDATGRRSKRIRNSHRNAPSADRSEEADELLEELEELRSSRPRKGRRVLSEAEERPQTRKRKPVDYRIWKPEAQLAIEDDGTTETVTPSKRGRGAGNTWHRSLFNVEGPFGGAIGPPPVFGGPYTGAAAGGADSDSSDDENQILPRAIPNVGGMVGMTPTTGAPPGFGAFPVAQPHNQDVLQNTLGKVKDKQALADADPLGVDQNVTFDGVGGLDGHIDQLKEMVALPLLYPEIFQRFKVTPPRGVLFHGPPGTGKTLLARALASSVSSSGRKVTFYMRKGADALSKWVGEAERQLRLLFDEARKNQPSIIFFDEIDGLAPVRSSKQDQIHASIVSTLLALMDGMDGRGQVVVIGATNRPDSVDPALRRPGRFDREFYFPLPNKVARKKILDIHTKNWDPPVSASLKDELAEVTKGYGGADLRALCTEAALNAVQRRYPQIYSSNKKLIINPATIQIAAKDFMISIKKIVPSSERSASSGANPLPKSVEPLLSQQLTEIQKLVAEILPQKKKVTALEEAKYEDALRDDGMMTERLLQEFERCRVFRPRLLIRGVSGMGQQYIVGALLHHLEGLHVQAFDLPSLLSDSTRSPEAATVQFFTEVKRHKPSVIYVPNVDSWYRTVGTAVISTFTGLLRSLSPSDPVLVLGFIEGNEEDIDPQMLRDLFGFSKRNIFRLTNPTRDARMAFFAPIKEYLMTAPDQFPEPANRKPRVLEALEEAPPETPKPPKPLSKEELKAQKRRERYVLNLLKIRLQHIFDFMKKYKKFRNGVLDESAIRYLLVDEEPPEITHETADGLQAQTVQRPYEISVDENGDQGLRETATGRFFYNLEFNTIEKRLQNGFYTRPKDFLGEIKKLVKDARTIGDEERYLRAKEIQANVEVDLMPIEQELDAECEAIFQRKRQKRNSNNTQKQADTTIASTNAEAQVAATIINTSSLTNGESHVAPNTSNNNSHPSRPSGGTSLTNGISDLSDIPGRAPNESNISNKQPSDQSDMMNLADSERSSNHTLVSESFGPSAQTRPSQYRTAGPSSLAERVSIPGNLSQGGLITPLAEGSNPHMYENNASTTSSSNKQGTSSGAFISPDNPQRMAQTMPAGGFSQSLPQKHGEGYAEGPALSTLLNNQFDTQGTQLSTQPSQNSLNTIPDLPQTQASQSSQLQQFSPQQQMPVTQSLPTLPVAKAAAVRNLLNDEPPRPHLSIKHILLDDFITLVVNQTSICTVEQLEQVYSGLMAEIWRTRANWNKTKVVESVKAVFIELIADIEWSQNGGAASGDLAGRGLAY